MSDNKSQEFSFDDLASAMASGNSEELNRLMDVKATPDPELNEVEPAVEQPAVTEEGEGDGNKPAEAASTEEPAAAAKPTEVEEPKVESEQKVSPEAELEQLRQELHRLRSDAGRVPFVQRRNQELERELQALRAKAAAKEAPAKPDDVELDDETKAMIAELRETDPVVAKAVERAAKLAIGTATQKVTSAFDEFASSTQEADNERYFAEQYSVLTSRIPQAPQIFASNEWKQWKDTLTPAKRAMAESAHADDVTTAIYAFAADMRALQGNGALQTQPAPVQVQTNQPDPAAIEAASKAEQARNRKVATAAEVSSSAAKATEEFDAASAFNEIYTRLGKENHILK